MTIKDYIALALWLVGSGASLWTFVSSSRRPGAQMRRRRWRACGAFTLLQTVPLGVFAGPPVLGDWWLLGAVTILSALAVTFLYLGRLRVK